MQNSTLALILFVSCLVVAGVIIVILIRNHFQEVKERKQLQIRATELKKQYDRALADKDRSSALSLGRQYYSALRGGKLTIYDEQALANDLSII